LELQALPTRITFLSHAPTPSLRRASFPLDEPLINGEIQRIASVCWVAPRAQLNLCGPELRAQQTARALGLEPSISLDLADVNYGAWRGKEMDDIQMSDPEGLSEWLTNVNATPHGGESIAHLIERVERWMERQTGAGHVLAITHPAVIRAAVLCAMEAPPDSFWRIEVSPMSVTDLRFNGRAWTLRSMGWSVRSLDRETF
jgi:broad specificity phosphatase PhoE